MSALHGFKRSNKADPSEISGQEMSLKEHIGEGAGELIQLFVRPPEWCFILMEEENSL